MRTLIAFTLVASVAAMLLPPAANAVQYPYLAPGYSQEIYTGGPPSPGPVVGGVGAWTSANALLTRVGSDILEYSLTQNATHLSTPIHAVTITHTITGLNPTGYGLTVGHNGYIYTPTSSGLQRIDPNNWASAAVPLGGTAGGMGYGITTLTNGRIAYSDGYGNSTVYTYNPSNGNNQAIFTANFLIDDMEAGLNNVIALAGQSNSSIYIINSTGTVLNSFTTPHYPDGLAFGNGTMSQSLYSNNNDGTITRYDLGPGWSGTPTITDIATGSGAYGDLAAVGPDCAFYVSQFENGGYHGCIPGVGTNWDSGTTNAEPSIIRIAAVGLDGTEICGFLSPGENTPEPATLSLLALGGLALLRRSRRK
ncbi:MAG: PEP-CTERM sorting domain-containing protein [Planctomycetota bacterium]|nr:PEP-CTERM sorting domain-containing protein [Planctomycetota bacterium]